MSNITLTMPQHLIRKAKVMAAQRDMSISGLVGQLLASASGDTADEELLWKREEQAMEAGLLRIGEARLSRDEAHVR